MPVDEGELEEFQKKLDALMAEPVYRIAPVENKGLSWQALAELTAAWDSFVNGD